MGIGTPPLPVISQVKFHNQILTSDKFNFPNSMSHDYHHQQGLFSFSNGFERSQHQDQQQHIAQQIRRDKLRVSAGFDPTPPPLVGIEEEEDQSTALPVYETAGMLSEMFNFGPGVAAPTELLQRAPGGNNDWYGGRQIGGNLKNHQQIHTMNSADSASMHLFLTNPQPRSPSPPPHAAPTTSSSSTLHHMFPPNPNSQGFTISGPNGIGFGSVTNSVLPGPQFTWVPDSTGGGGGAGTHLNNPGEIAGMVEGQGLSLSLSSSLQQKAEELRMGDGGLLYFNQGGGGGNGSSSTQFKNIGIHHQPVHFQGGLGQNQNHQVHVGFGSHLGTAHVLRNSKYVKPAQELLEEFCSVGRGQFKKNKFSKSNANPSSSGGAGSVAAGSASSTKDAPPLSAADRIEHQRRKVKLLSMLDEVDRRYNHYCEQMQMVMNSFDLVMGYGAAVPYTALAQKAMSRHFRCLKDAIQAQLKQSCELLGEKDGVGSSGITKGETPRLKALEQSLRQQRAFHHMGMMEQEAWRPQRGLPERSVNILRAWLFEHFLHPYPSDADKHLLARQTGLSRNQVSNWFINARVRLWKPMVEEMYQQEAKDEDDEDDEEATDKDQNANNSNNNSGPGAQTSMSNSTVALTGKRSEINANENDPSLVAINRQRFSENQAKDSPSVVITSTAVDQVAPPIPGTEMHRIDDTCRRGSVTDYGTAIGDSDMGSSTMIRFGTTTGDVSLTLGLRHAGNMPENASNSFSVRDFGGY